MSQIFQNVDTFLCRPLPFPKNGKGEVGVLGLLFTILTVLTYPVHREPLVVMVSLMASMLLLCPYFLIIQLLIVGPVMFAGNNEVTRAIESRFPAEILVVSCIIAAIGLFAWKLPKITRYSCLQKNTEQAAAGNVR